MTASEKIQNITASLRHICVGLDTDIKKIPAHFLKYPDPVFEFNKVIIENTNEDAAAYKINFAFYEKDGAKGFDAIHKTLELIPEEILTIADAKRGDIGNTSQMYAQSVYDHFNFDSVTLHPYMGYDSLSPFLEYKSKLNFILALTSNAGSADFEKERLMDGKYLYQKVVEKVNQWNTDGNCGIVFGATNLIELKENIDNFKNLFVLLPGVGAQGGSLEETAKVFFSKNNTNFLINISRALIYPDSAENLGTAVKQTIKHYNSSLRSIC